MLLYLIVKHVELVDRTGMRKTDCFGRTSLVPHVPSSSRAGKRCYYYDNPDTQLTQWYRSLLQTGEWGRGLVEEGVRGIEKGLGFTKMAKGLDRLLEVTPRWTIDLFNRQWRNQP